MISDLSRLRARWDRQEQELHKLQRLAETSEYSYVDQIAAVEDRIERTKAAVHQEELRLMDAAAKLKFSPKQRGGNRVMFGGIYKTIGHDKRKSCAKPADYARPTSVRRDSSGLAWVICEICGHPLERHEAVTELRQVK